MIKRRKFYTQEVFQGDKGLFHFHNFLFLLLFKRKTKCLQKRPENLTSSKRSFIEVTDINLRNESLVSPFIVL